MTDTINLSGLSLRDREYRNFGQDNAPLETSGPILRVVGGVYESTLPTYTAKDSVPLHFTSDGRLMTDTELEISGVVIGNVKVFSTDNTAPNAAYGKVGTDQTLIVQTSGGVLSVQSGTAWACSGLNYGYVIPSGTFYANIQAGSVITTQSRDMIGSMYIPAGSVICTQGRDLIGSMYIPAGSVIVTQGRDLVGSMYVPAGSVIITNSLPLHEVYISGTVTIGSVSLSVDEMTVISGNIFVTSGVNLTGSMWIPAGSVIVTQGRDLIGSMYVPAGSVIITQARDIIGSMYIPAGSVIVTNTVACSGLNYNYVIPSGTFILGSQTSYVNAVQQTTPWEVSGNLGIIFDPTDTVAVTHSGTFYIALNPTGTFWTSVSPSGTFYSNIQAGSVIVTNVAAVSGIVNQGTTPWVISGGLSNLTSITNTVPISGGVTISGNLYTSVIPSGTFILGSQTIYSNVVNKVEVSGLNYNYCIPSGTFILGSQTFYTTITTLGAIGVSPSGTFNVATSGTYLEDMSLRYAQRIDYEDGDMPIYLGLAIPGTATNTTGWQIRKLLYSGTKNYAITWGSGNNNFDKTWDNHSGTNAAYT